MSHFAEKLYRNADAECAEWIRTLNEKYMDIFLKHKDNLDCDSLTHDFHSAFEEDAYFYQFAQDMLNILENEDLSDNAAEELSGLEKPLAQLYDEWLSNDYSYRNLLEDTADDLAGKLVAARQNQAQKKSVKSRPDCDAR